MQSLITREISSAGSERLPYKQDVGGSNPSSPTPLRKSGGTGRRTGLKIQRDQTRAGSTPASCTTKAQTPLDSGLLFFLYLPRTDCLRTPTLNKKAPYTFVHGASEITVCVRGDYPSFL